MDEFINEFKEFASKLMATCGTVDNVVTLFAIYKKEQRTQFLEAEKNKRFNKRYS